MSKLEQIVIEAILTSVALAIYFFLEVPVALFVAGWCFGTGAARVSDLLEERA